MLYHLGLLDEGHSPKLERIKSQEWGAMTPELQRELDIALLTPGFSTAWWSHNLKRSLGAVQRRRNQIDPELRPEAVANWNSITREDCLKLTLKKGHKPVKILAQIAEDYRNGMTAKRLALAHRITATSVESVARRDLFTMETIPDWFRALVRGA